RGRAAYRACGAVVLRSDARQHRDGRRRSEDAALREHPARARHGLSGARRAGLAPGGRAHRADRGGRHRMHRRGTRPDRCGSATRVSLAGRPAAECRAGARAGDADLLAASTAAVSGAGPAGPVFDAKGYVATLPLRPGVYRMYAADGELLYVGKASRLRDRVGSYFSGRQASAKIDALVQRIARIEVTVAPNEPEALLLECNLIKAHRPRYNIALRDDKSYPYILCQAGHDFPRLVFYRGPRQPDSRQFGPFPSAYAVKEVLQHLQKVFRIRNCRD